MYICQYQLICKLFCYPRRTSVHHSAAVYSRKGAECAIKNYTPTSSRLSVGPFGVQKICIVHSPEIDSNSALSYQTHRRPPAGAILIWAPKLPRLILHPPFIPFYFPLSPFQQAAERDVVIAVDECAPGQGGRPCDSLGTAKSAIGNHYFLVMSGSNLDSRELL